MQLTLKNGKTIKLNWNWLVVERLEETVGSLENLNEKNIKKRGEAKTMGDIAYAVVQANINEEMTRFELMNLINMEDMTRIAEFVEKNNRKVNELVDTKK